MQKLVLTSVIMAALSANALAGSARYINISALKSSYDIKKINGLELDSASGFSISGAVKFKETGKVAVYAEGGYANLGKASDTSSFVFNRVLIKQSAETSVSSVFGAAKWRYAVNKGFGVSAKLGLNYATVTVKTKASSRFALAGIDDDKTELKLFYGLEADYHITPVIAVNAGYTSYASDVSSIQAGVSFGF